MAARMREHYDNVVRKALQEQFNYANPLQVPKLEKIVINMGVGEAALDSKKIEGAITDMTAITGQKPIVTRAKKSIAGFKLRENQVVGVKVTLRKERMYEFLDRLITIALPRVRDFRGVPDRGFDGRGNFTLGIKEHSIFPEINIDRVERVTGMNITIVTTAQTDKEGKVLLDLLGMPFRK